ncbi:hypothetical protein ACOMHN_016763 [Nucella lapillus]
MSYLPVNNAFMTRSRRMLKCKLCKFMSADSKEFTGHQKTAHLNYKVKCFEAAQRETVGRVNSSGALEEKSCRCPYCTYSSHRKSAVVRHVNVCPFRPPHVTETPQGSVEQSPQQAARNKKQTKHTGPPPPEFPCARCPFITNDLGDFVAHRALHRGEEEDSVLGIKRVVHEARLRHPRKRYSIPACRECSFRCLSTKELLDHEERAHGPHVCPYCSEHRGTLMSFLNHLADEHLQFKPQEWQCYFYMSHWC